MEKYKRITDKRLKIGCFYEPKSKEERLELVDTINKQLSYENIYTRLAELEDDLESGKMIRLPCKVGDRIWVILGNNIFGRKVKSILIHESYTINTSDTSGWKELEPYYEKEFGIIWFTDKAEAEKRIKELKDAD